MGVLRKRLTKINDSTIAFFIPKILREELNLTADTEVEIDWNKDMIIIKVVKGETNENIGNE